MDEIPEERDQDLPKKLSSEYLIKCAEYNKIDEWNALYLEYLESEWKRLHPKRDWDPENVLELLRQSRSREPDFKRPILINRGFREAIFRGVCFDEVHLEGAWFTEANLKEVNLKGAEFWRAHLQGANFERADLTGANFNEAHLEEVNFSWTCLKNAKFQDSQPVRAHLEGANLEEANFNEAHLEGANIRGVHLKGAQFTYAIVDGETMLTVNTENSINDKTNFTGTALSATRIDPNLRTRLERNIREIQWKDWYNKPKFYPYLEKIPKKLWGLWCRIKHLFKDPPKKRYDPIDYPTLENSPIYLKLRKAWDWPTKPSVTTMNASNQDPDETKDEKNKWETKGSWIDTVINGFVRLFWWISNYGSSTKRVIGVFFAWNIFWAFIYQFLLPIQSSPILENASTTVLHTPDIYTAVMQTNLMVFSITDVATKNLDYPALIFVTVQIVVGYFILAALITWLGIMFQNLSP